MTRLTAENERPAFAPNALTARYIGGPTALLEIGGLRLLTDPTFDAPGEYVLAGGCTMVKRTGPALPPASVGNIDAVLLSHDHHYDNLDRAGRAMLSGAAHVLTTLAGAERLGSPATPMPRWSTVEIPRPGGDTLRVTSVPAQHGPPGTDHVTGEVTGFVLSGSHLPTVYVSGDNASVKIVSEIAERAGHVDVAVLFAGAARTALVPGENLTLCSVDAARAIEILGRPRAFMLHFEGWGHFTEGRTELRNAFADAGLSELLYLAEPGETVTFW